ncbi:MAG: DNA-binding transcriptional regulator [Pirellulales bacterium]
MAHSLSKNGRLREVAILVETDNSWGSNLTRGVAEYAKRFGPWNLLIDPRDHYSKQWSLPDEWRGDGIIARVSTPLQVRQMVQRGLPAVNVDDVFEGVPRMGVVLTDEAARAQLAFDHLKTKGFKSFAYFAPPSNEYSRKRGQQFVAVVRAAGFACEEYKPGYRVGRTISQKDQHRRIARWLDHLPRPVSILAVDSQRGRQLSEICSMEGIRVPDDVAILAADTDDLLCDVCTPPLSSIAVGSQQIGHEAAAMLHRMMDGEKAPAEPVLVAPSCVVSRQSTDILAINDPMVVRALRFIQMHAFQGIVVEDVLAEVPISRRYLEREFKRHLGRLPAEEIRRIRLDRGKELVSETDMPIEEVSLACGYAGATQFAVAFRKRFGVTPLAYRKRVVKR